LAKGTSRDENLVVSLDATGFGAERRLPEAVEETLYRVAREAVNNISRHADAAQAWIELTVADEHVILRVRDNGRGFVVPTTLTTFLRTGHLGLTSLREQVGQLGGVMTVNSRPGQGTEISVRISLPRGDLDAAVTPTEAA
jgi:signal transduction histidine kinase